MKNPTPKKILLASALLATSSLCSPTALAGPADSQSEPGFAMDLSSNLIHDAAAVPNLGAEIHFGPQNSWSAGIDWNYIWIKSRHRRNRHWCVEGGDIHLTRWFGNRGGQPVHSGHHIGVFGGIYTFQIALTSKRGFISGVPEEGLWGSPAWRAGVEYGYSFPIARNWRLDLSAGLGYVGATVQEYTPPAPNCDCGDQYVLHKTHRVNWWGPVKAGVTLVWLFGNGTK